MPDDPRLRQFLDNWERNEREGTTVGNLHRVIADHTRDDAEAYDRLKDAHDRLSERVDTGLTTIRSDISDLRAAVAEQRGEQRGRAQSFTNETGTGRFGVVVAVPPAPGVPEPPKRPTWFRAVQTSAATKIAAFVLAAVLGWLIRHLGLK